MTTTNNVNPQEIAKFSQIAADWWNPNGKMKPLHLLNPLRLKFIQKHTTLKAKHILDAGCGGGILTESLAKAEAITTGLDLSQSVLAAAKQHAKQQQLVINYQEIAVEDLANQQAGSFEVVTCMEMLEHVPNPQAIIAAIATLLKPGGYAFFSTINRNPKAYLHAILGAEYLLNLLPKGTHEYASFIRPSELNQWAEQSHLNLMDLAGVQYSPFNGKFSLSDDVSVNYLACYQKEGSMNEIHQ